MTRATPCNAGPSRQPKFQVDGAVVQRQTASSVSSGLVLKQILPWESSSLDRANGYQPTRHILRFGGDPGRAAHRGCDTKLVDAVPLDDYTLASRLSYFLWSSMPNDQLFEAAASGSLGSDQGLRQEVKRMLADPKSIALRKGFASQWLSTRALGTAAPDPNVFPYFDEPLRAAMIEEAELFFDDFLHNGDREIAADLAAEDQSFDVLIELIALSPAFRMKGAE